MLLLRYGGVGRESHGERERWSCRVSACGRAPLRRAQQAHCAAAQVREKAAGIADSHGSFAPSFPFAPSLLTPSPSLQAPYTAQASRLRPPTSSVASLVRETHGPPPCPPRMLPLFLASPPPPAAAVLTRAGERPSRTNDMAADGARGAPLRPRPGPPRDHGVDAEEAPKVHDGLLRAAW
ncbi:hypothetical protein PVAP13_5NG450140 [Panicum virgatum]|uniref:Uncharacterized protein n=1 Tax=Panicum virgatum TaxID=38727 RepID=A0A8T0RWT3_PANVG|nr:hypothetical protein PVAP13_5NG450140 [Panicum virgatum]